MNWGDFTARNNRSTSHQPSTAKAIGQRQAGKKAKGAARFAITHYLE